MDTKRLAEMPEPEQLSRLDDLITRFTAEIEATGTDHPGIMDTAAILHLQRYKLTKTDYDNDLMISYMKRSLDATASDDPKLPCRLETLGTFLEQRYQRTADLQDLNNAITHQRRAVELKASDHPTMPLELDALGMSLKKRYDRTADAHDLNEAITYLQRAVDLTSTNPLPLTAVGTSPSASPDRTAHADDSNQAVSSRQPAVGGDNPKLHFWLHHLAVSLMARYQRFENREDLNQAIMYQQRAVDVVPNHSPDRASYLCNLGNLYDALYHCTADIGDVNRSIAYQEQALHPSLGEHPDKPYFLSSLGTSLFTRYRCTRNVEDLHQAIANQQQAVDLTPANHSRTPFFLIDLAHSLGRRFEDAGKLSDAHQGLVYLEQAREKLTLSNHPRLLACLYALGILLRARYKRTAERQDLDQAIKHLECAVGLVPSDHPFLLSLLPALGDSLRIRYELFADLPDFEESSPYQSREVERSNLDDVDAEMRDLIRAITCQQKALRIMPNDHPRLVPLLNNLGISFLARFKRLGDMEDLKEAIASHHRAVNLPQVDYEYLAASLSNLGHSLLMRYEREAELPDLDSAITHIRRAVDLMPTGHPKLLTGLNNLGNLLRTRYEYSAEIQDLEAATTLLKRAADDTPNDHPDLPSRLCNLAMALLNRYELDRDAKVLDEAIERQRQAVSQTPNYHHSLPLRCLNLGILLETRSKHNPKVQPERSVEDLDDAITHLRLAIDLKQHSPLYLPSCLSLLGNFLRTRYERSEEMEDLHQAIAYQQRAVDISPSNYPRMSYFLNNLALSLQTRYESLQLPEDLEETRSVLKRSAAIPYCSIQDKFMAAYRLANLGRSLSSHPPVLDLQWFSEAISWLPQLAWLGHSIPARQTHLSKIPSDIVGDAVACAIENSELELAIELLEQGRSILWAQFLQLRSELIDVGATNRAIADELREASQALERSTFTDFALLGDRSEEAIQKHHRHAERWERAVNKVREIEGFENFLGRIPFSDLIKAISEDGPVVVFNLSRDRCDALIITHGINHSIQLVNLPELRLKDVQDKARTFRTILQSKRLLGREFEKYLSETRRYLWTAAIQPVLMALDCLKRPQIPPRRIWWCPTGPLTFLPLHAAGQLKTGDYSMTQEIISSYTTSLTALARARSRHPSPHRTMAVIGVSEASSTSDPKLRKLDNASVELDAVSKTLAALEHPVHATSLEDNAATVDEVTSLLKSSSFLHFVCHTIQEENGPMDSGLCLADNRLSLSRIASLNLTESESAFLSSCDSAGGSTVLPDEAIHVAAGMQVAGYRSVIATMWPLDDQFSPAIVGPFYKTLFGHDKDHPCEPAVALRKAVLFLQHQKVPRDPDNPDMRDKSYRPMFPAVWTNFISIGI